MPVAVSHAVLAFLAMLVSLASAMPTGAQTNGWRSIEFETTEVTAPDVAVSPDGEWLIFTMLGKLFRLPVKGGEAQQLSFGPYYDNDPVISPDGKLVAFQSDRDGSDGNIFVLTLATREIRQVTRETWADRPAWAPDGQSLVYLRLERKSWDLASFDLNVSFPRPPALVRQVSASGGEPTTLRSQGPVWSAFYLPDGRVGWTLVERDATSQRMTTRLEVRDRVGRVSALRAFNGIADRIVASPKADGFYARFDAELYHMMLPYFAEGTMLFAPLTGGTVRRISPVSGERGGFAVSIDNATMYFGNLSHLWKVGLPGGRPEAVTFRARVTLAVREPLPAPKWTPVEPGTTVRPRTIQQPRLSPDGSRIVFRVARRLWQQQVGGGQAQQLVDGDQVESDPAFSPDGRELAFVRSKQGEQEIQILDFQSQQTRTVGPHGECGYDDLTWSTHGLMVSLSGRCNNQVIAIDPATGTRRVLTETSDWEPYPQLSADGKTLYFQADFPGAPPALYRKKLDAASRPELVVPATGDGANIVTNGQWLARSVPYGVGVWLAPLVRSGVAQTEARVLSAADGDEFSLAPDGSALLYVAGGKLWREPLRGGKREQIPIQLDLRTPTPSPVLIERARVLDFAVGRFTAEKSVMLENGRIQWIDSAQGRTLPRGTMTLDAGGRFLIPGLFDMHVHGSGCGGAALIAYGVTSARNMGGRLTRQNAYADRADVTSDALPRCFYAGRILEGAQGFNADHFVHPTDEEDARMYVRRWKAEGAQFIKLYEHLAWPLQRAAADEARRLGLPVAAHGNSLEQVVKGTTLGYPWLTHLPNVYDDVLQMSAVVGTKWDPTMLHGFELASRDEPGRFPGGPIVDPQVPDITLRGFWADQLRTVRSAYDRGITLLPGTDGGPNGLALQGELEFFAEAGIPPLDILRFATQASAQAVGAQDHLGTLEAGKLADLILLDANPLEDIKNTQKIWRVFKGGWMFDPKVLLPNRN